MADTRESNDHQPSSFWKHAHERIVRAVSILPIGFWLYGSIVFIKSLEGTVANSATSRTLKLAACRRYYDQNGPKSSISYGNIAQAQCDIPEVQQVFILLLNVVLNYSHWAAILMQLPMGYIADKKGHRFALCLNILGNFLHQCWPFLVAYFPNVFPFRSYYLTIVLVLVGGGPWVTSTLILASIHNQVPADQRIYAFSFISAIRTIAELIGLFIVSFTITQAIWISVLISIICLLAVFLLALLTPPDSCEQITEASQAERESLLRADDSPTEAPEEDVQQHQVPSKLALYASYFGALFLTHVASYSQVFLGVWLLLRFNQTVDETLLVNALERFVSLAVSFAILPTTVALLSRKFQPIKRDLILTKGSILLQSLGCFVIALAPNLGIIIAGSVINMLGSGSIGALLAVWSRMVDHSKSGRSYALFAVVGAIGLVVGIPLMDLAHSWALSITSLKIAIPSVVGGIVYLVVLALLVRYTSHLEDHRSTTQVRSDH